MYSYQFHIRDYKMRTHYLPPIADIAYRRLLDLYYTDERPLPVDVAECAMLIGMRDQQDVVAHILHHFFNLESDGHHNARCDAEIAKYKAFVEDGRRGAAKRWGKKSSDGEATSPPIAGGNATPIATINHKPETNNNTSSEPEGFDAFWSAYPRKERRKDSIRIWVRERLHSDAKLRASAMSALQRMKLSEGWIRDGGKYIPQAATWLNQRRWEDETGASQGFSFDAELQGAI